MNETLNEVTTRGIAVALEYIETAESFVVEQAPLLVQEVLTYGLVEACISAFITTALAFLFGFGGYRLAKYAMKERCEEGAFFAGLSGGGMVIGCTVSTFTDFFTIAKIIFAPRLYLLEKLQSLL